MFGLRLTHLNFEEHHTTAWETRGMIRQDISLSRSILQPTTSPSMPHAVPSGTATRRLARPICPIPIVLFGAMRN